MSACPHVVTSGEGTSFCSLAAAGPPSTLYCPNCGINRPWDEYGGDELETVGDDAVDHWPGTGMGLACPRCGVEAAPVTADGFVDRYARQWRPRTPRRGASNGSPPYTLTTVTVWDDVSPEPATEDGDRS